MSELIPYRNKPITLYVAPGGISEIDISHWGKQVERVIDVELTEQDANKLMDLLKKKIDEGVKGSVTFSLHGRLVI